MENRSEESAGSVGVTSIKVKKSAISNLIFQPYCIASQATINPRDLSDRAQSRIVEAFEKGVITNGDGCWLFEHIVPHEGFAYVQITNSRTQVPPQRGDTHWTYRTRPDTIWINGEFSKEIHEQLEEFQKADVARWTLMSAGKPYKQFFYKTPRAYALCGILTLPEVRRSVSKIIMTPERKALGKKLAEAFRNTTEYVIHT